MYQYFCQDADRRRLSPGEEAMCACCLRFCLCVLMTGAVSAEPWYSGEIAAGHTGASDNPFLIYDAKSLAAFADETNNNKTQGGFAGEYIRLMTNLNLNGSTHLWEPIGNTTSGSDHKIFKGIFDGGGYTISNMNVSVTTTFAYADLFGS